MLYVYFANKTPLGEPDGKSLQLFVSHVLRCLPCIYHPGSLQDIVSSVFIIHIRFKILSPLYLSSTYSLSHTTSTGKWFKASRFPRIQEENRALQEDRHSLRRQTKSCGGLGGGSGSSSLSLSLSHLSLPFLEEFCASGVLTNYFHGTIWSYISSCGRKTMFEKRQCLEKERNSNHLPCRSDILIVINQAYVSCFFR